MQPCDPKYRTIFSFLNADTCGGRNSVSSSWDEGLACYQCHVHIGNDHVDLVNKANKTSESELAQLSNCDADWR